MSKLKDPARFTETGTRQGSDLYKIRLLLLVLILTFAALLLFSLPDRSLHIDEAILGEHAYWLAKVGKVKADMYTGIGVGWEEQLLVYHKLFIWAGAGIISLFGLSLTALRLLSLGFTALLIYLLYQYCRQFLQPDSKSDQLVFLLSLLLLLCNPLFFTYSYMYRPEMMVASLGFGSFFALSVFLKNNRKKFLWLAAILAGLAALTHLNGLVYTGAGTLLLLHRRQALPAMVFALLASVVSAFYAIDLLTPDAWEQFILQFRGDPALEQENLSVAGRIAKFLGEHKRYFHDFTTIPFSILFLLSLLLSIRFLWKEQRDLLLYLFFAALGLAAISQGHTTKYALLFLPFAALLIAAGFRRLLMYKPLWGRLLLSLVLCYAGIQLYTVHGFYERKQDVPARNKAIARHIPAGSKVYATASFFFNEVENYKLFSTQAYYLQVLRYHRLSWSKEDFFTHVNSLGSEYIVLDLLFQDDSIWQTFQPEDFTPGLEFYGYQVIKSDENFVIMKKLPDQ